MQRDYRAHREGRMGIHRCDEALESRPAYGLGRVVRWHSRHEIGHVEEFEAIATHGFLPLPVETAPHIIGLEIAGDSELLCPCVGPALVKVRGEMSHRRSPFRHLSSM